MDFEIKKVDLLNFENVNDNFWWFDVCINDNSLMFDFMINIKEDGKMSEIFNSVLFNDVKITNADNVSIFEKNCNFVVDINNVIGKYIDNKCDNVKSQFLQDFFTSAVFKSIFYNFKFLSVLFKKGKFEFN